MFKKKEFASKMIPVPIAHRAFESKGPIEREKREGAVVMVQGDIDQGMKHGSRRKPENPGARFFASPPESTGKKNETRQNHGAVEGILGNDYPGIVKEPIREKGVQQRPFAAPSSAAQIEEATNDGDTDQKKVGSNGPDQERTASNGR